MPEFRETADSLTEPTSSPRTEPSADVGDAAPPRILGSRYLLEERIAQGGMASVWRAHDEKLARTVAIKVLHRHLAESDDFRERFRREAVSAAKLTHPGIVGVYDTGADGSWVYLVMEYVEGPTLADVLDTGGPLDPGHAARLGTQVAMALHTAAALGLVHRDVKPANILIDGDGQPKVTDFGIAKAEADADLTRTGTVLGTAAYLAPEQIRGNDLDHRADQYALGCVLYEALTGSKPFRGDTSMQTAAMRLSTDPLAIRSVRVGVPKGLAATVMRALERDADDRWPDNRAFAEALEAFATTGDLQGTDTGDLDDDGPVATSHSFLRSEGRWLGTVLALLAVAAVLVGVGLATGVIDADGIPTVGALEVGGSNDEDDEAPPEEAGTQALVPDAGQLRAFDPAGDGRENDDDLAQMVDGDPSTAWRTEVYFRPDFGGLKDGVGVIVDLGEERQVAGGSLTTMLPGVTARLYVAEEPAGSVDEWSTLGDPTVLEETTTIRGEPTRARYVLVWLEGELAPVGDERWQGGIAELEILERPT